jgi:hypothetical protein
LTCISKYPLVATFEPQVGSDAWRVDELKRLRARLRESVARGLSIQANLYGINGRFTVQLGDRPGGERDWRKSRLFSYWASSARAGRLDWAIGTEGPR